MTSLQLGVWQMLGRLLGIAAGVESRLHLFDCPSDFRTDTPATIWFRAPSLVSPPPPEAGTQPILFASAVVRPDFEAIFLDVDRIDHPVERPAQSSWSPAALRLAENAVRRYVEQWWCEVPLWSMAAEDTLPEFQVE